METAVHLPPLKHAFHYLCCGLRKFFLTSDLCSRSQQRRITEGLNAPGQERVSIIIIIIRFVSFPNVR